MTHICALAATDSPKRRNTTYSVAWHIQDTKREVKKYNGTVQ